MPTNTPRLGIPKPVGNEFFNREAYNAVLDQIDAEAAKDDDLQAHLADTDNPHGVTPAQIGALQLGVAVAGLPQLLDMNKATFTRASVAYGKNGNLHPYNVMRTAQGKYGQGAFIEEGTTNLLKNAGFDGTATNGLADAWSKSSAATHTVTYSVESGRQRIDLTASTGVSESYVYQFVIPVTAGQTYTLSLDIEIVSKTGSATANARAEFQNDVPAILTTINTPAVTVVGKGRYTVSGTAPAGATKANIVVRVASSAAGDKINAYFDNCQVENKAYATTPIVAPDTTTQAVRQPDSLSYTLSQPMPSKYFGCLVWKPDQASTDASPNNRRTLVFTIPNFRYIVHYQTDTKTFVFYKSADNAVSWYTCQSPVINFNAKDTIFVAWMDDPLGGTMSLWVGVNGGALQESSIANAVQITDVTGLYLGSRSVTGYEANGTIDFPIISDTIPTGEQVEALYRSAELGGLRNWPGALPKTTSIGTNVSLKDLGARGSSFDAQTGDAHVTAPGNAILMSNCHMLPDGSYQRYDTSKAAAMLYADGAGKKVTLATASAGAGPITWERFDTMPVMISGGNKLQVGTTAAVNASTGTTVVYPAAFKTATNQVFLTPINGSGFTLVTATSASQFTFQSNINASVAYYWLVFGD